MLNQPNDLYINTSANVNTMLKTFHVVIRPCVDTTGYRATCEMTDGGVNTDGQTIQEVEINMFEAMDLYLEDYPEITEYSLMFEVRNA